MNPPGLDLKAIFSEALDHAAGPERAAYLDRACQDDATLRGQVESLLKAHGEAGRFLGSSPQAALPKATADQAPKAEVVSTISVTRPLDEQPGTTIGPYKLLQKIGEGGMGTVFMAEQTQPVRRKVALKVIKPGMDTAQVIARFAAERQALAIMDHPNIARVLDVGATDTGRPFFVMELVKGVPITEYCDRNHLTPRERLELFIPVCQAIQHAHQKGIIHRDIKPSNVLVTLHDSTPVPKVIDFGVAKAIDQRLTERTMFTAFGAVIGTLEYMSPEQAEMGALDIDTRSDIYSLGVLLYELLTGSTPLERAKLREAAHAEILRRIREEEPPKPSTRLSESKDALPSISAQRKMEPARLTKLVRGELDWIVMKSLEKDRTRRYETANGFARDIRRYLDGDAVEACPPSPSYKLKKFARKHRAALMAAGAFALLLVAATAISVGLALWADRQRVRAVKAEKSAKDQQGRAQEREQMAIDAVRRYGDVVRETPELKNNPGLSGLRATLLKEPQAFFKRLRDRLQADRETTPDSLANLAAASFDLGQLTNEIGDRQDALRAVEESLAIYDRLARRQPAVTKIQFALAMNHTYLAELQRSTGRRPAALASHEQARAIWARLVRDNPSITQFQDQLAGSHYETGCLQRESGRMAEALASFERARAIVERLARDNASITQFQSHLAAIHGGLGHLQETTGRRTDALKSYEHSRAIEERLARENPSAILIQGNLAIGYDSIGGLQREMGRPADALASFERARDIRERLAWENPSVTRIQSSLAKSHHDIGVLQVEAGRQADGLASLERARVIQERLARENPSDTEFQSDLARSHGNIGSVQRITGRAAEAFASYEQARAIRERLARENPTVTEYQTDLALSQTDIGALQHALGRVAEAFASYEQARAIRERLTLEYPSVTEFQSQLATIHSHIGRVQRATGRPTEALASHERARQIRERVARQNPSVTQLQHELALSFHDLGDIQRETGRATEALASHEQARAIRERLARENPSVTKFQSELAANHHNIGNIQSEAGRPTEALASFERARAILERLVHENPSETQFRTDLAWSFHRIGDMQRETSRAGEALASHEQARAIRGRLATENPSVTKFQSELAANHHNIGNIQSEAGRPTEALASFERARAILERLVHENPSETQFRIDLAWSRYNAACAAALAAIGRAKDGPPPDHSAKAKLRRQALDGLKAELAAWAKVFEAGPAEMKANIAPTLKHWKADADLGGIRDEKELAKLPDGERAALQRLWKEVDALLTKATIPK